MVTKINLHFQLSQHTAARRVEQISNNLESQLYHDMQSCEYFSLQFNESSYISDIGQLYVFVRMVFHDFTVKEKFAKVMLLHERSRGKRHI